MKTWPRLPYQQSLRRLLHRLTMLWIAIYVPVLLILTVRRAVPQGIQWLSQAPSWLLMLVVLHWLVVSAGWSAIAYRWWLKQRREIQERQVARSLADLYAMSPKELEAFVGETFKAHGFKVWDIRFSGDHGIDLQLITPEGESAVAQVKRYRNNVGEPAVRDLFGTLMHAGADQAYLISTSGFSEPAREWAKGKPITLIDGRQLLRMHEKDK